MMQASMWTLQWMMDLIHLLMNSNKVKLLRYVRLLPYCCVTLW